MKSMLMPTQIYLFYWCSFSVTGVALGTGIAAGIIRFVGGVVSGGTITKGAHGYFSGTQYDYNLGAENRAVSPIVRRTYNGKAFNGNTRVADQAWKKGQKYMKVIIHNSFVKGYNCSWMDF